MTAVDGPGGLPVGEPALGAGDLVGRLWADVSLRAGALAAMGVPELGSTSRMIHDPDLLHLERHREVDLSELLAHLVPLLRALAERRDDLVDEVRLLREAILAESRRLAERDDLLHRLLEARIQRLEQDAPPP